MAFRLLTEFFEPTERSPNLIKADSFNIYNGFFNDLHLSNEYSGFCLFPSWLSLSWSTTFQCGSPKPLPQHWIELSPQVGTAHNFFKYPRSMLLPLALT